MFLVSKCCCLDTDGPIVQQTADRMQAARGTWGTDVELHAESDSSDVGLVGVILVVVRMLRAIMI